MAEKQRPEWWPPWEPNKYPPFTFHVEVWDAATEAAVKAVIERVEALLGPPRWIADYRIYLREIGEHDWQQLRKEAGLE